MSNDETEIETATETETTDESGQMPPLGGEPTLAIGSVLDSLIGDFPDVSISKIRFLESRGLIEPRRAPSGYRRFTARDVAQLRWILTMQRDHFLPLRVIKERLDAGVDVTDVNAPTAVAAHAPSRERGPAAPATPAAPAAPAAPPSRFRAAGPDSEALSADDTARLAGLDARQLDELVRFGLVEPIDTDDGARFGRDELRVAKAAGKFLARGIEARHLKAWKVAAEREAGMLEQILVPLSRQSSPDSTARAREVADDLIDMGNTIREAIIVKHLRPTLGSSPD